MDKFKSRLATAEHKRSKLEYRSIENIQVEAHRGKRIDKTHKSMRDMWDTHKRSNLCISEIPERIKSKNVRHQ